MVFIGIVLGIYAYVIFFLGLAGLLSPDSIKAMTVVFFGLVLFIFLKKANDNKSSLREINIFSFSTLFILLLVMMVLVNLVGVLGPELAFDALWYHLTLPKLYLIKESMMFVPGGLLYYSAMPKLAELLYLGGLALGDETVPKFTQFLFGIFTLVLMYRTSRIFVSNKLALFACVVFYANLVVAWESITAYVDLVWTFYAFGSVSLLLRFIIDGKKPLLYLAGIFVGLAISVKLVGLGSLALLAVVLLYLRMQKGTFYDIKKGDVLFVIGSALVIPLPWFLFSFMHTGNFLSPFLSNLYPVSLPIFSLQNIYEAVSVFLVASDPISPLYLICLPLLFFYTKFFSRKEKSVLIISGIALLIWFLTPKSGGGRFLLPFLPLFSVLLAILTKKTEKNRNVYSLVVLTGIVILVVSIIYRGSANTKYLNVVLGRESRATFLQTHLNFSYGDFYDSEGIFKKKIGKETALLIGFHNLYYVDFPYIDQSFVKKGDTFRFIAVQNGILPDRFSPMVKIHEDSLTGVSLYEKKGTVWTY